MRKIAFIRKTTVKGVDYLQVAEYFHDSTGKRRLKILKSFGKLKTESKFEAEMFLANVKKMEEIKENNEKLSNDELLKLALKISGGVIGAYIGIKILQWIFDDGD